MSDESQPSPKAREVWDVARIAILEIGRSRLPQMAAALSFRTIFGLVPVLAVGLVMLHAFVSEEDLTKRIKQALEYSGISRIAIEQSGEIDFGPAPQGGSQLFGPRVPPAWKEPEPQQQPDLDSAGPAAPTQEQPAGDGAEPAQSTIPEDPAHAERLDELVLSIVNTVNNIPFQAIGIVGVVLLIYAAISMLVEVERVFNHIYRARSGRSWSRRITMYWTLLTLGMILLFATFFVGERFKGWIAAVAESQGIGSGSFILAAVGFMVTVAISLLLLIFAYMAVPNARVTLRTAAAGAFVAAVVWEASKWAFTQYISFSGSSRYSTLYGSLAMIPVSLLWIYLTWLIVLLGLQVSYGLQMIGTWRQVTRRREREEDLVDPLAVLPLMVLAARRFEKGKPFDASYVAENLAIPTVLAERLLDGLSEAGHLNRIERGDDEAYALSRPPAQTRLADLLRLAQDLSVADGAADSAARCEGVIDQIRRAEVDAAGDKTIQHLLDPQGVDPPDRPHREGRPSAEPEEQTMPFGTAKPQTGG